MKDLAMYHAMALMYTAYGKYTAPYAEPTPTSLRLPPEPPVKLTGFTQITGRRRWSKKQRKQQRKQQLKNRKK
jgi:hypothetical protein